MTPAIPLEAQLLTARTRLRACTAEDIPHVWSATRAPGFNDGMAWDPPLNWAELEPPLHRARCNWRQSLAWSFTIESRVGRDAAPGAFLGRCGIRPEPAPGAWSIGYWIHPDRQRLGFATEAAAALLGFGFLQLAARWIEASHAPWNAASGRVLETIGMQDVGVNPRGFLKGGVRVPARCWRIAAGDWRAAVSVPRAAGDQ